MKKLFKLTTILLFLFFAFSCKKDKTIDNAKLAVNIYKDIPNKDDGLLVDVYDAETQYKTYFYGSFNDKGLPKDIKSIVLENKQSDTLHNYILDEDGKMKLVYSSMKNGTKLGSITKITEDENLLTLNFYDYNWNSLTDVYLETISLDITEQTNGERLEDENEEIKFDLFGLEEKRKKIANWLEEKITKTNENYAGFINSICSKTNGAFCGSSTLGLGGSLEDFNKKIKELTKGDVNISLSDFLTSPTSENNTPSENEFIPSSPTATTNTIPEPQTPINQVPTCVITNPSYGDKIPSTENITVTIEAADLDGVVSSVELKLDGISKGIKTQGIGGKVNFIIPANSLSIGSHYFYAIAKDNRKAFKLSNSVIFYIENDGNESTVTDIDGNIYHTVKIGTQTWMKENLKTTRYKDGIAIPTGLSDAAWGATTNGAYAIYDNNAANNTTYGKLYNWYAVNTGKLAPAGWHVPTDAEWTTLTNYLGGEAVAGGKMKATTLWNSPNVGATNSSGFTGLPAGFRGSFESFFGVGELGVFWSSTEYNTIKAMMCGLEKESSLAFKEGNEKVGGFSVRCVKD